MYVRVDDSYETVDLHRCLPAPEALLRSDLLNEITVQSKGISLCTPSTNETDKMSKIRSKRKTKPKTTFAERTKVFKENLDDGRKIENRKKDQKRK